MKPTEKPEDIAVKLDYFSEHCVKCHLIRTDGFFSNGYIAIQKRGEVYTITDDKRGDEIVFMSEIANVTEYRERT